MRKEPCHPCVPPRVRRPYFFVECQVGSVSCGSRFTHCYFLLLKWPGLTHASLVNEAVRDVEMSSGPLGIRSDQGCSAGVKTRRRFTNPGIGGDYSNWNQAHCMPRRWEGTPCICKLLPEP